MNKTANIIEAINAMQSTPSAAALSSLEAAVSYGAGRLSPVASAEITSAADELASHYRCESPYWEGKLADLRDAVQRVAQA
jgi:predicted secreted hydrolase